MSQAEPPRPRRERSARYPGVPLADCVELCQYIDDHGLDGLSAGDIALALGYRNVKTNTFSARLSAARQFGMLALKDEGYSLTPLARSILHPVDPAGPGRWHRLALREPPLYAELIQRLDGRRVPEAPILANVLHHHHQITASAKLSAAESFLESARFAGVLGPDQVVRFPVDSAEGSPAPAPVLVPSEVDPPASSGPSRPPIRSVGADVRIDLRLWGSDQGKVIRIRAPESISATSFERFLQSFRLLVRVEDPSDSAQGD